MSTPAPSREALVFAPHWPVGLDHQDAHRVVCDDKGRLGLCWLSVMVGPDGDAYAAMYQGCDDNGEPLDGTFAAGDYPADPMPGIRVRTYAGGGRNHRTHQALLWLARAIQLDNEENRNPHQPPQEVTR